MNIRLAVIVTAFMLSLNPLVSSAMDPMDMKKTSMEKEKMMEEGLYQEYSEEAFKDADTFIRVLYFNASWCPTCNLNDKKLSSMDIPEDMVILKVDYDSALELRQKYGITNQDTFVQVDEDGNEVAKWTGIPGNFKDKIIML